MANPRGSSRTVDTDEAIDDESVVDMSVAQTRGSGAPRTPLLMTVKDLEVELQLGRTRTYELVRSGELPVIRLGRAVRISRESLHRWLHERTVGSWPAGVGD